MGLTKTPVVLPTMLSPLGKACTRMDLTAVHDILLKTGYKDEEGAENEVSCSQKILIQDTQNLTSFTGLLEPTVNARCFYPVMICPNEMKIIGLRCFL